MAGVIALAASPSISFVTWLHCFAGQGLALPVIRMLGEAGEHRFLAGDTAFNATISNLGWAHRWIIHPHGRRPPQPPPPVSSVPYQIRKMHLTLAELDTDNFAANAWVPSLSLSSKITEPHPDILVGGVWWASAGRHPPPSSEDTARALVSLDVTIELVADHPLIRDWRAAIAACGAQAVDLEVQL